MTRIVGPMPWLRDAFVTFQDSRRNRWRAISAHAADVASELAQLAGAEIAFVHAIDVELVNAADTGIQPDVFVTSAKEDARS